MSPLDFSPGPWLLLAGADTVLFADLDAGHPLVHRYWSFVESGADLGDLLAEVNDLAMPSFALVRHADPDRRVVVRGDAVAVLADEAGATTVLRAGSGSVWLDHEVDGPVATIALTGPMAGSAVRLPLGLGAALAADVRLAVPQPRRPLPAVPGPEAPEPLDVPTLPEPRPVPEPPPPPAPSPPASPEPEAAARDTVLLGADRTVLIPPTEPARPPHQDGTGVIQWLGFTGDPPPPAPPLPPPPPVPSPPPPLVSGMAGAATDAAVTRIRAPRAEVPAVRCGAGHANPPRAVVCRVCAAEVPAQEPELIARPMLGVLRMAGGEPISLDRAVIVGRSPDPTAGTTGARANAIRVESPGLDVSRNHAEFRADGWQLVVTDLGSANGTTVTRPDATPEAVRRNGSVVVEPGAVVTLAGEVSLRFEVTG